MLKFECGCNVRCVPHFAVAGKISRVMMEVDLLSKCQLGNRKHAGVSLIYIQLQQLLIHPQTLVEPTQFQLPIPLQSYVRETVVSSLVLGKRGKTVDSSSSSLCNLVPEEGSQVVYTILKTLLLLQLCISLQPAPHGL